MSGKEMVPFGAAIAGGVLLTRDELMVIGKIARAERHGPSAEDRRTTGEGSEVDMKGHQASLMGAEMPAVPDGSGGGNRRALICLGYSAFSKIHPRAIPRPRPYPGW